MLRSRMLTVVLGLALGLAGGIPAATGHAQAPPDPGLGLATLAVRDCATVFLNQPDFEATAGPVTCGSLSVPENWRRPGGRTVEIAFVVLESTGAEPRADPVVYLEGGPGGSSLSSVPFLVEAFAGLRESRDIVLYDQRGTAYSSPLLCSSWTIDDLFDDGPGDADQAQAAGTPVAAGADAIIDPTLPPGLTAAALLDEARADVGDDTVRCAAELLSQGVDLRQYNSIASATDLVALMRALGYDAFNLYGISYGTRLALVTMREYPGAGIRSVVVDSTYPPGLPGFERNPSEPHEVVLQLFADCALDPACGQAYPDLKARFVALLASLDAAPLDLEDGTRVTADDLVEVMQGISGMVAVAPYVPRMIAELEAGRADTYRGIVSGSLMAALDPAAAATPAATPAAAEASSGEPRQVVSDFLAGVGIGDSASQLSPAQRFLAEVVHAIGKLPVGQENDLATRLFLLDKLPPTRDSLVQFVERGFADPRLAVDRAALLDLLATFTDADVEALFAYLDAPARLVDPSRTGLNALMFQSVECNESVPFQSFDRVVENAFALEIPQLGLNNVRNMSQVFAVCEVWPTGQAPDVANQPVASDIPTLIFAGTYDMATPMSWNKQAFVTLPNASLFLFPMSGHGVLIYHNACATTIADAFFADPIYVPGAGCIAGLYPEWAMPDA